VALTKFNYNSFDLTTAASKGLAFNSSANGFETSSAGAMTLIKTLTASSSSTLSFLDGSSSVVLDNTYPVYLFKFINIHPATDNTRFVFQVDTGTNTNYNQTITSAVFRAYHNEGDSGTGLAYRTAIDQAQGTAFQKISESLGNGNDESASGELYLFSPSSSVFVKHFMARVQNYSNADETVDTFIAGYVNTTTALTRVQFKIDSGNIDSGTIKLYGIKDS
tara:strand:+ start:571 stop:1233 length:663 start_codon:yes stop_codon:yes gene_type:complete